VRVNTSLSLTLYDHVITPLEITLCQPHQSSPQLDRLLHLLLGCNQYPGNSLLLSNSLGVPDLRLQAEGLQS
jgi:hypothetical protein